MRPGTDPEAVGLLNQESGRELLNGTRPLRNNTSGSRGAVPGSNANVSRLFRTCRPWWLLAPLASLLLAPPALASTPKPAYADEVFTRINGERQRDGIAPLGRLRLAELAAQLHAMDMANREYMSHDTAPTPGVTPDPAGYPGIRYVGGMGPGERLNAAGYAATSGGWGENVGYNYGYGDGSPADSVRRWMNSGGHRNNILDGRFKATGIGCAVSASGKVYYSQVFVVTTSGYASLTSNAQLWGGNPTPGPGDSTAPGGWSGFAQDKTSFGRAFRVGVRDGGSGLAPATAAYRVSADGGRTWSAWAQASCTGSQATTTAQQLTTPPLTLTGGKQARVQFRVADAAGNVGASPSYSAGSGRAKAKRRR